MTASDPPALAACSDLIVALARDSIRHGLERRRPLAVDVALCPAPLRAPGACFVSLHLDGDLRGCIGQNEHSRPLAESIAENAYAAAFRDPRFGPLTPRELDALTIEVHVLSALEPLRFADLAGLYALLRPGTDGLRLEAGERCGVFLPVMWEALPTPEQFVTQLLRKAGIARPAGLSASRFSATVFR